MDMKRDGGDVILFAVVGMSPAVLTETVWALAHENVPVIPDEVVVLTTTFARKKIEEQLLISHGKELSGWDRLLNTLSSEGLDVEGKLKFGLTGDSLKVFTDFYGKKELSDIATSQDNEAAADFMLKNLRSYTSNPATTVVASIAGGRKTMSALMISCMSLLGREQDRVCHVLVNPPYDGSLTPPFLFPVKGLKHKNRENKTFSSMKAEIELTDVPFVRMLGWYMDKFERFPPKYSRLVAGIQKQVPTVYPVITLDMKVGKIIVDKLVLPTTPIEFAVFYMIYNKTCKISHLVDEIQRLQDDSISDFSMPWFDDFQEHDRVSGAGNEEKSKQAVSKIISSLRTKLLDVPPLHPFVSELVPQRGKPQTYPNNKIKIKGKIPFIG